jgi:NAD(P)-dependent dehydrogenase (short-subunit alcohol dehydrogenase family)
MNRDSLLNGKVVIVTGGSGLLGKAIVDDIRSKGGVAINADISLKTDLNENNLHCDITSLSSIMESLQSVFDFHGKIDGLVNNAYPRTDDWGSDFEVLTQESLRKNVDWQLNSYILFCQQAIKFMKPKTYGSIVNIASIYGIVGNDFSIYEGTSISPPAAYTAIKGGLINFSRFLASKYGSSNIRINVVSPGGIWDHQPDSFVAAYEAKVPMKRMGNPDDIAPSVSFLLSDEARYITGHNLIVDGGWTAI